MNALTTVYGEKLNRDAPLGEHPDPQFRRERFLTLNGLWDFSLDQEKGRPERFNRKIVVPFAVESSLSGLGLSVHKGDYLHYRRKFHLDDGFLSGSLLLHFEAVDQICDVFLNGERVLHHEGGYLPFSCLIERPQPENVLELTVSDDTESPIYARGKQSLRSGGIWYTATSGVWQSVWLEGVPRGAYIKDFTLTPHFDERKLNVQAFFAGAKSEGVVEAFFQGRFLARGTFGETGAAELDFRDSFYPWTEGNPNLYELRLSYGDDLVHSYFAMRKFSVETVAGERFFALNGKPMFLSAPLDQGYYPDGGLTPPSEKAMEDDILLAKRCGYNCIRKHIKIEPRRWYCLCDRLGMLVFQDFVSGGSPYHNFFIVTRPIVKYELSDTSHRFLGRFLAKSRLQFEKDLTGTYERLKNVPSLCAWTLFNEGWGQFDSLRLTERLRSLDPSRPIDSASGWFDKKTGDFKSHHVYFVAPRLKNDHKRILSLSECGGFSLGVKGHKFSRKNFGYAQFKDKARLSKAVRKLYGKRILRLINRRGLGEAVFTQLTDVENETNGIVTYDRKIEKIDPSLLNELNQTLYKAFDRRLAKRKKP
jgi:beta-galactosidase/beta-glucuronidase